MADPATGVPLWEQRFRAPSIAFPHWARHAPDRLAVASNESGAWQVYAWDRATGARRQVTDDPIGVPGGAVTPGRRRSGRPPPRTRWWPLSGTARPGARLSVVVVHEPDR